MILAILFVLLLRTYNRIATTVFRVQQEKEVSQEMLQISQIMQNFSDRNTIDYPRYAMISLTWLVESKWITWMLYLTGQDWSIAFFSSGDCKDPIDEYTFVPGWSSCSLFMITSWNKIIELINPKKIAISKVVFKIIPFASQEQYIANDSLCLEGEYLHCLNAPWFRMVFKAYSPNYGLQRATHVVIPFQQFF